ncbi:MAG: site-2 protease family protein [Acidimicrobiales bacterium]
MESASIRLGRIAGVPVGLSWSLLIIAAVFALGLAEGRFPNSNPGYGIGAYWLAALITVAVFFSSILVHELSHAIVAKRHGLPVEGITLWLLGGVANLGGESPSPRAELRIAGVGPISSGVLALGFWGMAWSSSQVGLDPLAVEVLAWLALINALLAAFNALPAAPLDGGRVLAAVWWWRTDDRTKGLVGAAHAGRLLGAGLLGFAGWQFLTGDGMVALWTALIGWFIWQSAVAEGRSAVARGSLAGITAVEAARPDPPIVDEWLTVDGLIAVLGDGGDHTAFVVRESDGVLRSIVTLDDIRRVPPNRRGFVHLADIATPIAAVTTAWDTEPLIQVFDRIPGDDRPEIVVYDSRLCLVGVISRADLSRLIHQAGSGRVPTSTPSAPPPPPRTGAHPG